MSEDWRAQAHEGALLIQSPPQGAGAHPPGDSVRKQVDVPRILPQMMGGWTSEPPAHAHSFSQLPPRWARVPKGRALTAMPERWPSFSGGGSCAPGSPCHPTRETQAHYLHPWHFPEQSPKTRREAVGGQCVWSPVFSPPWRVTVGIHVVKALSSTVAETYASLCSNLS